ncbi:MAG TPA: hypothetical protein VF329_10550 [Gammaproteobacteria bacterium]
MRKGLRLPLIAAAALAAGAVALTAMLSSRLGNEPAGERAASAPAAEPAGDAAERPLRYDVEYPAVGYSTTPTTDRISALAQTLADGRATLEHSAPRGYLDSLLEALQIDPASQVLVFSATSLQVGNIRASTPRAIYFNDDVYVAWVQGGGPIEIASMDPKLGPVFYTLDQTEPPQFDRQMEQCLRCHDSLSLTGGGVPRFIVGSGYIGAQGNVVAHEGWILTTQRTPLRNRFGGWYVTGRHGDQVHLGNIVVRNIADLTDLESLRVGNLDDLDGRVDMTPYLAPGSDIVALLVLQHQVDVQNEIARVGYRVRTLLPDTGRDGTRSSGEPEDPAVRERIAELTEPLVETMLFVGEAEITSPITGSSSFQERFEQRGPRDRRGRSLRELDLTRRLLRYPLSYLVYSEAFDALPGPAKAYVYRRFGEILRGEDRSEKFAHLSPADRTAVLEILADTKPEIVPALERSAAAEPPSSPAGAQALPEPGRGERGG